MQQQVQNESRRILTKKKQVRDNRHGAVSREESKSKSVAGSTNHTKRPQLCRTLSLINFDTNQQHQRPNQLLKVLHIIVEIHAKRHHENTFRDRDIPRTTSRRFIFSSRHLPLSRVSPQSRLRLYEPDRSEDRSRSTGSSKPGRSGLALCNPDR